MSKLAALALMLAILCGPAGCGPSTCQGDNLKKTIAIVQDAYLGGVRLAYSRANFLTKQNQANQLLMDLLTRAQSLPEPCQKVAVTWGNAIFKNQQVVYGSTKCMGGVCCNNSGCVGG